MKLIKDSAAIEKNLKVALAHYGTVRLLARALGAQEKTIYRWMCGESLPTLGNITRIEMLALKLSSKE